MGAGLSQRTTAAAAAVIAVTGLTIFDRLVVRIGTPAGGLVILSAVMAIVAVAAISGWWPRRDRTHRPRLILDSQPDMRVIADAPDGATALDLARRLLPDVVLADIRMPKLDGLELTRALAGPDVAEPMRVVVVTTFDLDEYVHAALRNGACGFFLKRSGPALLVEAVRAAMAGDALISSSVTVRLLRHLHDPRPRAATDASEPLTDRELEVARLVADGKTNAEIGEALFVAAGTIKTHVANIQRKLGVRNRVGIAVWMHHASRVAP